MTTTPTDETEQRSATRPLSGPPPSALPMPGGPAVLGVSADFHDSAAALVVDGIPYAAAEEERFSRLKHDPSIPALAIEWITAATDLHPDRLDAVVFAGKPLRALDRVISSHASAGVRSLPSLTSAVGVWSRRKIWIRYRLEETLRAAGLVDVPLRFCDHHLSHAAAAFYPSPFEHAAVLTLDGVGDWETGSISKGTGSDLHVLKESRFPDSLGLWYSAMTAFCGFPANEGEYRLMGLAPYGTPRYRDVMSPRALRGQRSRRVGTHDSDTRRRLGSPRPADPAPALPQRADAPRRPAAARWPGRDQVVADLDEIVDLAVEGQHEPPIAGHHRLGRRLRQVKNLQPAVPDRDAGAGIDPCAGSIWTAPLHRHTHRPHEVKEFVIGVRRTSIKNTYDAAHLRTPKVQRHPAGLRRCRTEARPCAVYWMGAATVPGARRPGNHRRAATRSRSSPELR